MSLVDNPSFCPYLCLAGCKFRERVRERERAVVAGGGTLSTCLEVVKSILILLISNYASSEVLAKKNQKKTYVQLERVYMLKK